MINTTTTTDKVQIGSSTTGKTTTSSWQTYKAEQGWECPRCGRINAPWVRQCDCSRSSWTITCDDSVHTPKENDEWYINWAKDDCAKPWWYDYKVTCKDTSGQAINADTFKIHPESITYSSTISSSNDYTANSTTAKKPEFYTETTK